MDENINQTGKELSQELANCTLRIKELERQIMENEKFVAAGRMTTRIVHEINNLLAGINNSFTLIKDSIPKDHKYYKYKNKIEYQIDKIAHIVRQVLDPYKPDHETTRKVDIITSLRDVMSLFTSSCTDHDVTMNFDICAESVEVDMVENLFKQVLFNIIQNAIEASPDGGVVKVAINRDKNKMRVTVSDQGDGIPDKLRSIIYEPFFTTKSENPMDGSGLGLSTAKGIAESMGGSISFSSLEVGVTVFTIEFPMNMVKEEA